tara:strand:+ start:458 stop:580 length:123 start_codon:yes stop_codon:yes gene_type:complete
MMALISFRKLLDHAGDKISKIKKAYRLEEMHHRYKSTPDL